MFCLSHTHNKIYGMDKVGKALKKLYFSPKSPASFTGDPFKLFLVAKRFLPIITERQVIHWLRDQHTFQLHKSRPNRRIVHYARVIVPGPNHQLDVDLMHVTKVKSHNSGNSYILVMVDVFSRKAYAATFKVKSAEATLKAFKGCLDAEKYPLVIRSDRGKEFEGCFDKFFRDNKIQHYWALGAHKANYAK